MERKHPFIVNEIYHLFSRGVEKRKVFTCTADYERFIVLLLLSNSEEPVHIGNLPSKYQGESLMHVCSDFAPTHTFVDVLAYALMPNHFHLMVREKRDGGISTFMRKLMTSYSMYFNIKNERSGPLFTRPFRSQLVDSDAYLRWLFAYIHLNPLELSQPNWKRGGINKESARSFMRAYTFSSLHDFYWGKRIQSSILNIPALPLHLDGLHTIDDLITELSANPEYQGESLM